ncbi:uncharacterized protein LOC142625343 [Castanea sativa]|uniref:uncharacterized protein LOC142625343 n=1 Tax=Castanea sativa TaxID=21020 RepID=UPI003F651F29
MSIARPFAEDLTHDPKRSRIGIRPALSFSDEDKVGTLQPHDDALLVTLRIGGYNVKRVLVDQGCFDGKTVILKSQIRSPVQAGSEVVEVDFFVVDAYSPYTTIMARPWLHAIGTSTLYLKVKYPSGDQVEELIGSQSMAR